MNRDQYSLWRHDAPAGSATAIAKQQALVIVVDPNAEFECALEREQASLVRCLNDCVAAKAATLRPPTSDDIAKRKKRKSPLFKDVEQIEREANNACKALDYLRQSFKETSGELVDVMQKNLDASNEQMHLLEKSLDCLKAMGPEPVRERNVIAKTFDANDVEVLPPSMRFLH